MSSKTFEHANIYKRKKETKWKMPLNNFHFSITNEILVELIWLRAWFNTAGKKERMSWLSVIFLLRLSAFFQSDNKLLSYHWTKSVISSIDQSFLEEVQNEKEKARRERKKRMYSLSLSLLFPFGWMHLSD